ncbi:MULTISPECIES: DUF5983 family protein [Klebsiella/Raoultella group]|uniref:DUF5983 family protein n=1 Tax=Klebsiella/Raoultella group TaxID=2890311 RepID=UPI000B5A8CDC|nr:MULTISPECIES: DUF5983 family protein [Klebsiella/Raoultella group]ELT9746718.1 hypothetical protein [Klebsiella michiganensis]MCY0831087.1 DUF5983 family protein [Klebsiella michiganensis]MDD7828328.1 DUF5983 family protein [Klebsiella michiganensis]MDD7854486.1 DUF5983 family protein [Klebsiella michiganensis]MTF08643.1 hypothetical protein [Raoultella ornithinolytica]
MKIDLNISSDSISVLALNMGKIEVDVDGIEIAELITAVNAQGFTLRIAEEPGEVIVETSSRLLLNCLVR